MPMRNVTLRQMRVFAAVAQYRSFTRAARELHLTQPAISQQIKLLETEIGLPLLEHVGRQIHLTDAGDELLRYASQVNDLLRDAGESLAAMRGLRRGVLKLGAVSTAKYFAPSLLSAFAPAYPEVTIRFTVGNREEIIQQLASNQIDLVIMGRPPRELVTVAEPFAKHPLVIIASPRHPLANKRRIPLQRLGSERFIIREEGSGTRASMEHVFRERGVPIHPAMEVSSNETIKQAVMAGMGLGFISIHTVGLELATGKLVILNVAGLPLIRDWYVIHLRDKRLSPITAAFRSFLLEQGATIIRKAAEENKPIPLETT
ncbi:LysR family transcriptional regulator [Steroidobacter sp. S1-65]|uniref:LysR family transcriptional regulator n=1 Tax=Steroidobacter gossypii TaxID=2805490 RepID=A0ABS1X156_9GAMM|nr:LysR family transcriptional regulator [Steroidobacter gossypii]MBM0106952.1 LysR family transcriptional regulator [Steroidobacter gossypii]